MWIKFIILNFWKSVMVMGCILYLSFAQPSTFKGIPTFQYEDKLVHLLMYFGLGIVLIYEFRTVFKKKNTKSSVFVFTCIVFPVVFGGLIEILQPMFFFPRTASWLDWFADITGVLMAWGGMFLIKKTPTLNPL